VGEVRPTFFVSPQAPRYYVKPDLEAIVRSSLAPLGLELFELRQRGSSARPILDVRVERADGGDVTIDDCATASRAIEARLDAERPLGERYVLEVSSPGVERPLRGPDDWRRSAGKPAVVTSDALGGAAEVEIVGVEDAPEGAVGVVRTARGDEVRVPFDSVRQARLAFHWKR
jgi:ribosome maturation factor RimP